MEDQHGRYWTSWWPPRPAPAPGLIGAPLAIPRFAKDRVAAKRSELERLAEESSKATATKVEGEAPENLRTYRRASQQNPLSPASVRYFHSFSWAQNFFQKLRNGIRCEKVTRRGTFCSRLLKIDDNLSTLSWPSLWIFMRHQHLRSVGSVCDASA